MTTRPDPARLPTVVHVHVKNYFLGRIAVLRT